jgi:pyruvate kinase
MRELKKTKIVATISDLNCDKTFLQELYDNGMNVVRINTAHQTYDKTTKIINNVREISHKIGILLDTKGPEIRTTKAIENIEVKTGDIVFITGNPDLKTTKELISVNYEGFVKDIPVGSEILIDDGELGLTVVEKLADKLKCQVGNDGYILGNKSVNIPSVEMKLDTLSVKDKSYIEYATKNHIDFIAHSFVRSKEDVIEIQNILDKKKSSIKIIAKIENQEGVDNIDEILDHAYGIMIARGDLAVEIAREKIPFIQKKLIKKCITQRKPVIIATQMLHSMIKNPRPTRAEVNDVANAIYDGTDAIMLSGETAYGDYPIEAVKTMNQVAIECEKTKEPYLPISTTIIKNKISSYLCNKAVKGSVRLDAEAIIADTMTGQIIRNVAGYRGQKPVYAFCYTEQLIRELALSYGIHPIYIEITRNSGEFIQIGLSKLVKEEILKPDSLIVVLAGNFGEDHGASFIEISDVKNLMSRICISYKINDLILE